MNRKRLAGCLLWQSNGGRDGRRYFLPRLRMVSGEAHSERVLTDAEEAIYLANATPLLHDLAAILIF